jgi:hypothetical protein
MYESDVIAVSIRADPALTCDHLRAVILIPKRRASSAADQLADFQFLDLARFPMSSPNETNPNSPRLATLEIAMAWVIILFASGRARLASQPADNPPEKANDEQQPQAPPVAAFPDGPDGGKYGFINRTGAVVIKPKYDWAGDFVDGHALVQLDGKLRLIDAKGNLRFTLPAGTKSAYGAREGMVWHCSEKENLWGLLDDNGRTILKPKYDDVRQFSDGMAAVNLGAKFRFPGRMIGGKWGFVDKKGNLIVPIKYEYVGDYSEGLGRVTDDAGSTFLDKSGRKVLSVGGITGSFREGVAPVREKSETRFVDRQGKSQFTVVGWAEEFHDGLSVVSREGQDPAHERPFYGYIDRQGKLAIPTQFVRAKDFSEGLAAVWPAKASNLFKDQTWGYVDKTGKYQIQPQFNEANSFHGGVAKVHVGGTYTEAMDARPYWAGGEWWLIDQSGRKLKRSWLESRP